MLVTLLAACTERPVMPAFEVPELDVSRTVEVTATGRMAMDPNLVSVDFVVVSAAPNAQGAFLRAQTRMADLKQALERAGARRPDMVASDYRLDRVAAGLDKLPLVGSEGDYRMTMGVDVVLRDVNMLPDVLAAAETIGVERIENVRFGFVNALSLDERARERAIAQARAKAQILAEESQLRVGELLSVVELPRAEEQDPQRAWYDASGQGNEFIVTVRATFALSEF